MILEPLHQLTRSISRLIRLLNIANCRYYWRLLSRHELRKVVSLRTRHRHCVWGSTRTVKLLTSWNLIVLSRDAVRRLTRYALIISTDSVVLICCRLSPLIRLLVLILLIKAITIGILLYVHLTSQSSLLFRPVFHYLLWAHRPHIHEWIIDIHLTHSFLSQSALLISHRTWLISNLIFKLDLFCVNCIHFLSTFVHVARVITVAVRVQIAILGWQIWHSIQVYRLKRVHILLHRKSC